MKKSYKNKIDRKTYLSQSPLVIVGIGNIEFGIISTIFIVILFCISIFLSKRYSKGKASINVIEDSSVLLNKAMNSRIRFDILGVNSKLSQQISGYITDLQNKTMIIETSQFCEELIQDQEYKIYFRLKREHNQDFYECSSKLIQIEKKSARAYNLLFLLPKYIQNGQKREFFRITPATNQVPTLMLWLAKSQLDVFPTHLTDLKTPNFAKSKNHKQIKLDDISSSGVRITLLAEENNGLHTDLAVNDIIYFIIGTKYDPEKAQQVILTQSSVRRINQACKNGDIDIGLQFMNYATIKNSNDIIKWYKCEPSGEVPILTNWITLIDQQNVHRIKELERARLQGQN